MELQGYRVALSLVGMTTEAQARTKTGGHICSVSGIRRDLLNATMTDDGLTALTSTREYQSWECPRDAS
eukprot:1602201-Amphidinium_carterae.1